MAHTVHDKKKLRQRINRIRGQVNAVGKAIEEEKDCSIVLLTLAACRGALNSLMAEVMAGHLRCHVLDPAHPPNKAQAEAVQELVDVINSYLK